MRGIKVGIRIHREIRNAIIKTFLAKKTWASNTHVRRGMKFTAGDYTLPTT